MKENNQTDDILINIGTILKERREELSYSIRKVAETTRISVPIIQHIENGNHEEFPSLVFVRGFIRNYCTLLKIDSDPLIHDLNRYYRSHSINLDALPDEELVDVSEKQEEPNNKLFEDNKTIFFSILASLVLIGFIIIFFINTDFSSQSDDQITTLTNVDQPVEATQDQQVLAPKEVSQTLKLLARENGWIRLKIDNNDIFEQYLYQGRSYEFIIKEKLNLTLSKGSLVKMSINNETIEIEEDRFDQLLSLEIDLKELK